MNLLRFMHHFASKIKTFLIYKDRKPTHRNANNAWKVANSRF